MDFEAYEREGRREYEQLARTIAGIIEAACKAASFRIQQVQHRAKGVESLRGKLIARGVGLDTDIEDGAKDLAGCRVILYTNQDVAEFVRSGVIWENFEVDWDKTKFHYPTEQPTADNGFISYNYVVRLKPERTALPEYAQFAGMACEIQVQTTLDHAWSEMAHNTIYKAPPPGFGSAIMKDVSARMTDLAQKYLRPAGFEFQKIASDVRAFERGRALFEKEPLKLLAKCVNNNDRHELLGAFAEEVHLFVQLARARAIFQTMFLIFLGCHSSSREGWAELIVVGHDQDRLKARAT